MSHIYWELKEIPIPKEAYINTSDGRVFLMNADGTGKKKRRLLCVFRSKCRIIFMSEFDKRTHNSSSFRCHMAAP